MRESLTLLIHIRVLVVEGTNLKASRGLIHKALKGIRPRDLTFHRVIEVKLKGQPRYCNLH